jgi:colanic acid biosynthesis protein WcaH
VYLSKPVFETVISSAPLVSVDLVVRNTSGQYLVGLRQNRPAKGFWFVPGGRILKNESVADAFKRITQAELGQKLCITSAKLKGAFDHFYSDCVFGEHVSTHYVALGYELTANFDIIQLPSEQHSTYKWLSQKEMLEREDVHQHTKWYVAEQSV